MENLPEEMVTEILSRLPVKSIIRCKAVRKAWYALSKNPNFVAKHLSKHQFNSNSNLMFSLRWIGSYSSQFMFIINPNHHHHDEEDDEQPEEEIIPHPCSIQLCEITGLGLGLIGHCDGLIALDNYKNGIIVCNPATREFRFLPISSFLPFPYFGDVFSVLGKHTAAGNMSGFGFDSKLNDYKLVRVVTFYLTTKRTGFYKRRYKAEVFCIRSDSCWRQLDDVTIDPHLGYVGGDDIKEPLRDGVLYWRCKDDETKKHVLVTFNVADEVFGKLPMPQAASEVLDVWDTTVSVGVFNGSLAVYIFRGDAVDKIHIWVMKDTGTKGSWTKQLTIDTLLGASHLCFLNSSDEELLYVDKEGQLAIDIRVIMESKSLSLYGKPGSWRAISYMKTLVSVE